MFSIYAGKITVGMIITFESFLLNFDSVDLELSVDDFHSRLFVKLEGVLQGFAEGLHGAILAFFILLRILGFGSFVIGLGHSLGGLGN